MVLENKVNSNKYPTNMSNKSVECWHWKKIEEYILRNSCVSKLIVEKSAEIKAFSIRDSVWVLGILFEISSKWLDSMCLKAIKN